MNVEIIKTKSGYDTIKVEGYLLHSKYNPIKEAEQFAKSNYSPNKLHILYGYGLGYFAEKLYSEFQFNEELIVIDPFFEVKNKNKDFLYIDKTNISMLDIFLASKVTTLTDINLVQSPNYDKIDTKKCLEILASIRNRIISNKVSINTINYFANQWYENNIYNLSYAINDHSLKELVNKYDCPIVVASGGPSLTKQLPLLKKYRDKIILISAGSTINSLLASEIIPDYVVSIDGGEANLKHFSEIENSKISYIYSLNTKHEIREHFKGDAFYFNNKETDSNINSIIMDDVLTVRGGSSVAVFCLEIATLMTSGPIALIGQDLAYTNNLTHAVNNKNMRDLTDKKSTTSYIKIKGFYGDQVNSDAAFITMKNDFELSVATKKKNEVYNCTEGGAFIKGMIHEKFQTFCQLFCLKSVNKLFLEQPVEKSTKFYYEILYQRIKMIKKTTGILENNLLFLKKDKKKKYFETKTLKILDKNEKLIEKNLKELDLSDLIEKVNIAVLKSYKPELNETKEQEFYRVYNQNEFLYNQLIESLKIAQTVIGDFLKIEVEKIG